MGCPFAILGLSRSATKDEVRKAYRELARKYHPDKGKSSSGERMKMINAAYEEALRILDAGPGYMAYQNLNSSHGASKPGYNTYQAGTPGHGTYQTSMPSQGTYKTTQTTYTTYQTGKSRHGTYKTTQPSHTTYKTNNSSYGGYKASEPSYTTYYTTGLNGSSSAYGSSRARDDLRFSEFGESRSRHQESSRGSRRTEPKLPEWVLRQGQLKKSRVEEAERELQAMQYGSGRGDLDTLVRNLERHRRALRSHNEWVEEGLEYGYDFDDI